MTTTLVRSDVQTLPTPGSFECISVFDAEHSIDLDQWVGQGPVRQTIDTFVAEGWRPVTVSGREGDRVIVVLYDRVLADYDDTCVSIDLVLSADGTYVPGEGRA